MTQSDIMIVNDNPANLKLLEEMLQEQGHEVTSFPLGRLAAIRPVCLCWYLVQLRICAGLRDVAAGRFRVEGLTADEHGTVARLDEQYADLDLGLADLSVVILATGSGPGGC